ncbi:MAG: diguanylate cyclase, partial [Candidatus Omnitrophica bacterium]|nr:diguanylate cyclase [Candidatus Omnitrophota bacterium]
GFLIIKNVIDRIVWVARQLRNVTFGDMDRKVVLEKEVDEVEYLQETLSQITQRIRHNMNELKSYSEKTSEINNEIQKRVLMLSSLLQVSNLISQGERLENILRLALEKLRLLTNAGVSYFLSRQENSDSFTLKVAEGMSVSADLLSYRIEFSDAALQKVRSTHVPVFLNRDEAGENSFLAKLGIVYTLAVPIVVRGKVTAVLGLGDPKDKAEYRREDAELLNLLSKQIVIAIENDALLRRIEKLEIKDTLTGLYNESFIRSSLKEEIKRAITYQRPCALVLFDIDLFKDFADCYGSLQVEAVIKKIAVLLRNSVSEIDRVGKTGDDEFVLILPERNKRQALSIADEIRKKIEFSFIDEPDAQKKLTISGGVSENPLDGVGVDELFSKARELLFIAKSQGRNRVVGFKDAPLCPPER